jgi:hypothetical protein
MNASVASAACRITAMLRTSCPWEAMLVQDQNVSVAVKRVNGLVLYHARPLSSLILPLRPLWIECCLTTPLLDTPAPALHGADVYVPAACRKLQILYTNRYFSSFKFKPSSTSFFSGTNTLLLPLQISAGLMTGVKPDVAAVIPVLEDVDTLKLR